MFAATYSGAPATHHCRLFTTITVVPTVRSETI